MATFCRLLVFILPLLLTVCSPAFACSYSSKERRLQMVNVNNGEELDTIYFKDGRYLNEEVFEISKFMRDRISGKAIVIDTKLVDFLCELHEVSGSNQPYRLFSGYRTENTNKIVGGKKESQHLRGRAADVALWDVPIKKLYIQARKLKRGGVGLYDWFIHIDVGRPRSW